MKKILAILIALAVLITACAQKPSETPAEAPAEETPEPLGEAPAEVKEEPKEETPAPKEEAPANETPKEEPPAEVPKAETDEQFYDIKEGDTVAYKGKSIVIEDLTNQGNYITMFIEPIRYHLYALNKPEILDNIEYMIVENNFNTANSVKLRIRPVKLGENERVLVKDDVVTVNNTKITLGTVGQDSRNQEYAYVTVGTKENWVKLGDTLDAGSVLITLKSAFHRQKQYAILKIVPK